MKLYSQKIKKDYCVLNYFNYIYRITNGELAK